MVDLTEIKGGGKPNVLKEALRNIKENMKEQLEWAIVKAQIQRAKYLALKKEGFTDEQALELCKEI